MTTTSPLPLPKRARRGAPAAPLLACLLLAGASTAAHGADRGADTTFSIQTPGRGTVEVAHASGWLAGTALTDAGNRLVDDGTLELDMYGGYRGDAGPLAWSALVVNTRFPGTTAHVGARRTDYTELVTGASWMSLYARYHAILSPGFVAVPDARGAGYLDVGAHQPLGHRLTLDLHAVDGHADAAGGAGWRWRDMKAGLTRGLEDHWRLSMNVTRAIGSPNLVDRFDRYVPGTGGATPGGNLARRAVVVSLARSF